MYHNEAEAIFHPKVYLFRKGSSGKLIVGSNNLTGAGLFQNTEAGLAIEALCSSNPIKDAVLALKTWMDTSSPLVKRLDDALLTNLEANGYVISEAALSARHKAQKKSRTKAKKSKIRLFGALSVPRPAAPASNTTSTSRGATKAKSNGKTKSVVKAGKNHTKARTTEWTGPAPAPTPRTWNSSSDTTPHS